MMYRVSDSTGEHVHFPEYELLAPRAPKVFTVTNDQFTLAYTFLIATAIVEVIAVLVFFARVWTRALPAWRFTLDDYIISVAFILMTVMFGLQYRTQTWAWGGTNPGTRSMNAVSYTIMLGSISLPFWAWATGLVKISIACMLLRFQQSPRWRIPIYLVIGLNILFIGFMGIAVLFQCIPYASIWDFKGKYPNRKCWSPRISVASLWVSCLCNVISDVVLSLMPLTFLGKIRRPLKEKVVVGGLMGLGLLASSFSLARLILTCRGGRVKDIGANTTLTGLLACLEVQTSLIAACIPTLRSSSRRLLGRIGILRGNCSNSVVGRYGPGSDVSGEPKSPALVPVPRRRHELHAIDSSCPSMSSEDDDDDSQYIMDPVTGRITRVSPALTSSAPSSPERDLANSCSKLNEGWKVDEDVELGRMVQKKRDPERQRSDSIPDSIGVAR
ncbi:hypothetical protein BDV95DRAFT_609227 [Massariosphaeria phaeospora]|uniref:Rhodopsin domain-containing protein n=1 Tax=Massariosphaeria phaeospora TaxID=100035 RepID=A0A7C8I2B0_9PLEO|nr:hypothetical protein BDV95DRAFT_609227 [Massariosphaeria phaeospora]